MSFELRLLLPPLLSSNFSSNYSEYKNTAKSNTVNREGESRAELFHYCPHTSILNVKCNDRIMTYTIERYC